MRGRKHIATFKAQDTKFEEMATVATNNGAYSVQSLVPSIVYILDGDTLVIASSAGSMTVSLETAKIIAGELPEILKDYKADRKNGRVQMSTRDIQRMLKV